MSTVIAPLEERGVSCSLDNYLVLPDNTMDARIAAARRELGARAVILGHHYQRDEVIRFADFRGDSYKLAQEAARTSAEYIVFCGVHFMAESADVLAQPGQQVILPDLNAGCSMADMAEIGQVESCWEQLIALGLTDEMGRGITPLTYMNSTAAIKAFAASAAGWCAHRPMRRRRSSGRLRAMRKSCFCLTSTWGATRHLPWAFRWSNAWCGTRS